MNSQITRRADKVYPNCSDRCADKRKPTVQSHPEQDKGIQLFDVALRWAHSSLRVSI